MNVNAGTTRGRRKSTHPPRGDDHYSLFSSGKISRWTRGRGIEDGRLYFFAENGGISLLLPDPRKERRRRRLTCSYRRAARIVCTGRAIEAHSSAIACTLFFFYHRSGSASSFRLQFQGYIAVDLRVLPGN